MEEMEVEIRPEALLNTIHELSYQKLDAAAQDVSTNSLIQKYEEYQIIVWKGHLGKTGQFWISFKDNVP
jgi:hypothetical protein